MDGDDNGAAPPPRRTYMPKPPGKDEVDVVSGEQAMVTDDWTGEPSAREAERPDEEAAPSRSKEGDQG